MRPRQHFAAKEFNAARTHAKEHGYPLQKYEIVVAGKKVVKYYSGKQLPKHIAKRAINVETKKI